MSVNGKRRISVEVLEVSLRVVLEKLVIKILAGIEMTWWESKPFLLLGMVAGMPLSSFLLFHCALVVVVVVVDVDGGHVAIGLSLSQHCLLLAHRLRYLLPQLATLWHITYQRSASELLGCQHSRLLMRVMRKEVR